MIRTKEHFLWKEKYRPEILDNYIGSDVVKFQMDKYIKKQQIPHLLMWGPTGTGKTSLAKLLIKNLNCTYDYLNASDENGIDVVRTKIKNFASTASLKPLKIFILDDTHNLTVDAQNALLPIIEQYSINTRFILTTNHKDKLIPALLGRLIQFEIVPTSKKDVMIHLAGILESEGVEFVAADVKQIVNRYFPSIRMCIDNAQDMVEDSKLVLNFGKVTNGSYLEDVLKILKVPGKDAWTQIRQLVVDQDLYDYTEVFRFLYDNVDVYSKGNTTDVIVAISEAQYRQYFVPDREINVSCMFLTILESIKK